MMEQPNEVTKLVFAYQDDAYNRPRELTFPLEIFPNTVKVISQKCGKGHNTLKSDCQIEEAVKLIKDVIYAQ